MIWLACGLPTSARRSDADRALDPQALSPQEARLLKHLDRVRKLFGILRLHRRRRFDDEFQAELERRYRDTGLAKSPYHLR